MQVNNFIFDVDGTLTPSRGQIDKTFGDWFLDFSNLLIVNLILSCILFDLILV